MSLRRLFLPDPPRHLPHSRTWNVASRSLHLVAISVLVGGHVFAAPADALIPWLWFAIATGGALMLIELYPSVDWLAQVAGVVVLVKLALLCVIPFAWDHRVPILFLVLVMASVGSHMKGHYRHYSLIYRRNVKGK